MEFDRSSIPDNSRSPFGCFPYIPEVLHRRVNSWCCKRLKKDDINEDNNKGFSGFCCHHTPVIRDFPTH
jgi:hypothetical protein